jgi:hypothetical protein
VVLTSPTVRFVSVSVVIWLFGPSVLHTTTLLAKGKSWVGQTMLGVATN